MERPHTVHVISGGDVVSSELLDWLSQSATENPDDLSVEIEGQPADGDGTLTVTCYSSCWPGLPQFLGLVHQRGTPTWDIPGTDLQLCATEVAGSLLERQPHLFIDIRRRVS